MLSTPAEVSFLCCVCLCVCVQELASSGGLYKLRVHVQDAPESGDGAAPQHWYTSVKACALLDAGLKHKLLFNFDSSDLLSSVGLELPDSFVACPQVCELAPVPVTVVLG